MQVTSGWTRVPPWQVQDTGHREDLIGEMWVPLLLSCSSQWYESQSQGWGRLTRWQYPLVYMWTGMGLGHVELRHSTLVCMRAGWDTGWTGLSHSTCQHMQKLTLGADLVDIIGGVTPIMSVHPLSLCKNWACDGLGLARLQHPLICVRDGAGAELILLYICVFSCTHTYVFLLMHEEFYQACIDNDKRNWYKMFLKSKLG